RRSGFKMAHAVTLAGARLAPRSPFDGLEVEPVIVEGEPAPEIAKAVRDYDIDLVTVVTHGRRGLARALFGSTAEEIIAEAPCPVLTIRPPQRDFVEHRG